MWRLCKIIHFIKLTIRNNFICKETILKCSKNHQVVQATKYIFIRTIGIRWQARIISLEAKITVLIVI
jgi:hypothetical protein